MEGRRPLSPRLRYMYIMLCVQCMYVHVHVISLPNVILIVIKCSIVHEQARHVWHDTLQYAFHVQNS